jgi:hypothetical protein
MEYLIAHFPRSSPLHARIQRWLSEYYCVINIMALYAGLHNRD